MLRKFSAMALGLALAVGSFAMSGCTAIATADAAIGDATATKQFAFICKNEPTVHLGFELIATQVKIPDKVRAAEAAAHGVISVTCANPPVDIATALATVADAYAVVLESQASVAKRNL